MASVWVTTYRSEDRDGFLAEPDRVEDVVVENGLEQIVLVIGLERRLSGHHLVHQHPERPPVHRGAVLQLLQDLSQQERVSTPSCVSPLEESQRGYRGLRGLSAEAKEAAV